MALIKTNARSATALDATILTGNLPAISGASLTGIDSALTPSFSAYLDSSDQSIASDTYVKIIFTHTFFPFSDWYFIVQFSNIL